MSQSVDESNAPLATHAAVTLTGIALGVLGNYLLWTTGLANAGFAVWVSIFVATVLWLQRRASRSKLQIVALWSLVALAAALILLIRNADFLMPLMWLVMLSAGAMTMMQLGGITLRDSRIADLMMALLRMPLQAMLGAVTPLRNVNVPALSSNPNIHGVVRGLLLALPLLVIFTLLFASADAGFSRLLPNAEWLFSMLMPQRLALIAVVAWIAMGLLQGVCSERAMSRVSIEHTLRLGTIETTVIMGLLATLFVVFVIFQLGYLFGGQDTIVATTGMTLADYARRGFFELVAVAGLTLAVLLALGAASGNLRIYRILAAVLVLCVLIILASAAQRLDLYTDAYGLTLERVVAAVFMAWVALSMLFFSATVLRGKTAGFAATIFLSGIALVLVLALANPAARVTAINIDRAVEYRQQNTAYVPAPPDFANVPVIMRVVGIAQIDLNYLLSLGADAVPALLARLEDLNPAEQCRVASALLQKWSSDKKTSDMPDWRSWNASKARAYKAVGEQAARLQEKITYFNDTVLLNLPVPTAALGTC